MFVSVWVEKGVLPCCKKTGSHNDLCVPALRPQRGRPGSALLERHKLLFTDNRLAFRTLDPIEEGFDFAGWFSGRVNEEFPRDRIGFVAGHLFPDGHSRFAFL